MLIKCTFYGTDCDLTEFTDFQMGEFTKCYKYTPKNFKKLSAKDDKTLRLSGKQSGLHLELFVGFKPVCSAPLSSTAGLMLYIHNETYTLTEEDNAILIRPGTEANIAIDRTFFTKLSKPYGDCIDPGNIEVTSKSNLIKQTIALTGIYTQQYCLQLCYQEFLLQYCNCYDHTLPKYEPKNRRSCPKFIDSLYNCQYLIKRLFYNGKNDRHCLKDCPSECEFIQYDTTVSTAIYPTESYLRMLNMNEKSSKFFNNVSKLTSSVDPTKTQVPTYYQLDEDSVLAVNIFYERDAYTKITERPETEPEILM
jgi:hypothetical protein